MAMRGGNKTYWEKPRNPQRPGKPKQAAGKPAPTPPRKTKGADMVVRSRGRNWQSYKER